ncbi:MAG: YaaR family protein [Clostridiales bacterium]|nr:YaaR family protein [Clostridiales bacterium]
MDLKISETTPIMKTEAQPVQEKKTDGEFTFALNRVHHDDLVERLNGMMDEITVQGKKIADHMDIKDLKHYKSLIGNFIEEVVTNSHKFSRENFLDMRGRHRVYGIVKLVNKQVDELAQDLLAKEKDHIKILDRTDEIRGLLLDILI